MSTLQHGCARRGHATAEYRIWKGMNKRCSCPSDSVFRFYGGRGIRVCDRWSRSFVSFLEDMGPRPSTKHTIDRIDPSGNYEPRNCRWLLGAKQNRNRRDTVYLTIQGETKPLAEWAEQFGIPASRIHKRLAAGFDHEHALFRKRDPTYKVTIDGKTRTVSGWAKSLGYAGETLLKKIRKGRDPHSVVLEYLSKRKGTEQ